MDEVTNAEIARRLDDFASSVKEDFAEIRNAQAAYVLREVYEAKHTALINTVDALQTRVTQESEQRRNLSRWVIGSVVLPVIFFGYQIVSNLQGAGT